MYSVGSFLELVTAAAAWRIYAEIWHLLVSTGLAYLPFAAILFTSLRQARERSDAGPGLFALRLSEMRLYLAFAVVLFCVVPTVPITPEEMVYAEQSCTIVQQDAARTLQQRRAGESNTTYDFFTLGGEPVLIPAWWWLLNNLAQGITAAAINALPCNLDLRGLSAAIASAAVKEPELQGEVTAFHRDCWQPARRLYAQRRRGAPETLPSGTPLYEDLAWAGSSFFLDTPGYYDSLFPGEGLRSFPYEPARDGVFATPTHAEGRGWPSCRQWWRDDEHGLRGRLLSLADRELQEKWYYYHRRRQDSQDGAEDALLRRLLNTGQQLSATAVAGSLRGSGLVNALQEGALTFLAGYTALQALPEVATSFKVLRDSAPILQALVLLLLILSLPILLATGSYSLEAMLSLSLIFMSVVFWGFLFKLVYWIDSTLIEAVLPKSFYEAVYSSAFALVFQAVAFLAYMLLPLLFTRFMQEIGRNVGINASQVFLGGNLTRLMDYARKPGNALRNGPGGRGGRR